jgi:hypothetical protein
MKVTLSRFCYFCQSVKVIVSEAASTVFFLILVYVAFRGEIGRFFSSSNDWSICPDRPHIAHLRVGGT